MRILSLHLHAFGPFVDATLPLTDERSKSSGLTIVYGPNEAGKSTALRAVRQLLFGIDGDRDAFRIAKAKLRIGGRVRDDAGDVHEILRRGSNSKALFRLDDKTRVDDEALLDRLLGSLDAATYETRYGLHHDDLEAGAQAVLESSGSLSGALFAAAAKTKSLQKLRDEFTAKAEALFKARARKGPEINGLLDEFDRLEKEEQELVRTGDVSLYVELKSAIAAIERDLDSLRERKREEQRRAKRLRMLSELYLPYRRRRELATALAELADVPTPERSYDEDRRKLDNDRIALAERLTRARQDALAAQEALEGLGERPKLLAFETEVDRLFRESAIVGEERRRSEGLVRERERLQTDADRALSAIGKSVTPGELDALHLSPTYGKAVAELIKERGKLDQEKSGDLERCREMRARLEDLSGGSDEVDDPGAAARLTDAVARAEIAADLTSQRDRALAESRTRRADVESWIARNLTQPCEVEDLNRLPIPVAESIESANDEFKRRLAAETKTCDERNAIELTLVEVRSELRSVDADRLPTLDDLRQARAERDEALRTLVDRIESAGVATGALFESANADAAKKEIARLRTAIAQADEIADVLQREATRVANVERVRREERACIEKLRVLDARREALAEERRAFDEAWKERWAALGVAVESPKAALAWRRDWANAVALAGEALDRGTLAEELTARIEAARAALLRETASASDADPSSTLDELLSQARRSVKDLENRREAAIARKTERDTTQNHLRERERNLERIEVDLREWQERWDRKIESLPQSQATTPDAATDFLERLGEWKRQQEELRKVDDEIRKIEARADGFASDVHRLAGDLGENLSGPAPKDPAARVRDWVANLKIAKKRDDEESRLRGSLEKAKTEVAAAEEGYAVVAQRVRRICEAVGIDDPEWLDERLEAIATKRRALDAARNEDEYLAARSPDATWEAIGRELADWTPETLEEAIAECEDRVEQLDDSIGKRIEELRDRTTEKARWDGQSRAADLEQSKQRHLAELADLAERYAVYRLASAALERSIESYRDKNKSPILERAGRFFKELTCGAFVGLEPTGDDEREISVAGIRGDEDGEIVPVAGMSRGTCDQLYLAFRMALWEERLEKASPIPIVLDDVLVHFDDDRATAALRAFDRLAQRTQIVYFTHHRHLIELARQALPGDRLHVEYLNASAD